jgi:hypothetical protein
MYYFYFMGALGQAVHQAVSKKRPKSPKLDIPFYNINSYGQKNIFTLKSFSQAV